MVIWSDQAKADLKAIHEFIARDSTHYAKKVTQEVVEQTDALIELPQVGRVVPELHDENVRELALYSYRIIYEIKSDDIIVLAVIHKRRDLHADEVTR